MNPERRILVEVFGPALLAAIILDILRYPSDGVISSILGFPSFLMFAYAYAIAPSVAYAGIMELWFRRHLHFRYGLLSTAGLSAVLGLGAGFLVQLAVQGVILSPLPAIGAFVGLMISVYVYQKEVSARRRLKLP